MKVVIDPIKSNDQSDWYLSLVVCLMWSRLGGDCETFNRAATPSCHKSQKRARCGSDVRGRDSACRIGTVGFCCKTRLVGLNAARYVTYLPRINPSEYDWKMRTALDVCVYFRKHLWKYRIKVMHINWEHWLLLYPKNHVYSHVHYKYCTILERSGNGGVGFQTSYFGALRALRHVLESRETRWVLIRWEVVGLRHDGMSYVCECVVLQSWFALFVGVDKSNIGTFVFVEQIVLTPPILATLLCGIGGRMCSG